MNQTVTATEARVNFGRIIQQLTSTNRPITVERGGKRQIVMLSVAQYEQLVARANANTSWQTELDELHQLASAELQGRPLPDPAQIIAAMRDERDTELEATLDLH